MKTSESKNRRDLPNNGIDNMTEDKAAIVFPGLNFNSGEDLIEAIKLADEFFEFLAAFHSRYGINRILAFNTYESLRSYFINKISSQKPPCADKQNLIQEADNILCGLIADKFNEIFAAYDRGNLNAVQFFQTGSLDLVHPRAPFYGSGIIPVNNVAYSLIIKLKNELYNFCRASQDQVNVLTAEQNRLILDYVYAAIYIPERCPDVMH